MPSEELSPAMRDILLLHVSEGKVPRYKPEKGTGTKRGIANLQNSTVYALVRRGLLVGLPQHPRHVLRFDWTEITEAGLRALEEAFVDWIGALAQLAVSRETPPLTLRLLTKDSADEVAADEAATGGRAGVEDAVAAGAGVDDQVAARRDRADQPLRQDPRLGVGVD